MGEKKAPKGERGKYDGPLIIFKKWGGGGRRKSKEKRKRQLGPLLSPKRKKIKGEGKTPEDGKGIDTRANSQRRSSPKQREKKSRKRGRTEGREKGKERETPFSSSQKKKMEKEASSEENGRRNSEETKQGRERKWKMLPRPDYSDLVRTGGEKKRGRERGKRGDKEASYLLTLARGRKKKGGWGKEGERGIKRENCTGSSIPLWQRGTSQKKRKGKKRETC